MRSALLLIAVCAGYALLRGFPEGWSIVLRICLAVTFLVAAFMIWGTAEKSPSVHAEASRKPGLIDVLTGGIAILLVELFFLLFFAIAPEQGEKIAIGLDRSLHPETYGPGDEAEESEPDFSTSSSTGFGSNLVTGGKWLWQGNGARPLRKNGSVRPSNKPEVYLFPPNRATSKSLLRIPRFLRSFTLATYRGDNWLPIPFPPKTHNPQVGQDLINFAPPAPDILRYEVSHLPAGVGQSLAISIPGLSFIAQPSLREIAPDTFRLPPLPAGQSTHRYAVGSNFVDFDLLPAPLDPGLPPSPEYLSLPEDAVLAARIRELAAEFGPPSIASLIRLRTYFKEEFSYSLEIEASEDADPLAHFLFKSRTGYCTHFASATTLLTRAMGIPSRIAYGWSGGRYFEGPNLFVFRAREAHAWTEIYLREHGWVVFETTPAGRDEAVASIAPPTEAPPIDAPLTETPPEPLSPLSQLQRTATIGGIIGLAAFLLSLFCRRPKTTAGAESDGSRILPDPPNYLSAFRRACTLHGHPMPPGRTLRAHLESFPAPAFTTDILNYHYAVHYGKATRDKSREKSLTQQLKSWEKEATTTQ